MTESGFPTAGKSDSFRAYVETQLVKTLKPGDFVVLDNLSSHKGAMVRNFVRAAGARLFFLPPYSPVENAGYKST